MAEKVAPEGDPGADRERSRKRTSKREAPFLVDGGVLAQCAWPVDAKHRSLTDSFRKESIRPATCFRQGAADLIASRIPPGRIVLEQ